MSPRFVARPCADENGRTWDVWDRVEEHCIVQCIPTRQAARARATRENVDAAAVSVLVEALGVLSGKFRCPCCGQASLTERGMYEICGCGWEDDGTEDPHVISGPNHQTLAQARRNLRKMGATDKHWLSTRWMRSSEA